jgi:hypothetical protein
MSYSGNLTYACRICRNRIRDPGRFSLKVAGSGGQLVDREFSAICGRIILPNDHRLAPSAVPRFKFES